jgi:integrase
MNTTQPMPKSALRAEVKKLAPGEGFRVDFIDGREPRRWFGNIVRPAGRPGLPATAMYTAEWCATCATWHSVEDMPGHDSPWDLPPLEATTANKAPIINMPAWGTASSPPMRTARTWHVWEDKPPHVHKAAWARLAPSTRKDHIKWLIRLKYASSDLADAPIAYGAVELVMRLASTRKWAWPTIAANLSQIATAVGNLMVYTNSAVAYDIRHDTYFDNASKYAQQQARLSAVNPYKSAPLTMEQFTRLAKEIKRPEVWLLLIMSWALAARVGDVRRLHPSDVQIGESIPEGTKMSALFRRGKGAAFWGPFVIHVIVPEEHATRVREHIRNLPAATDNMFEPATQAALSRAVNSIPGCSLRSIRKGSLTHVSEAGATDAQV